ncbi:hypothetical protein [Acanthamoeba polyphaga mimivirus]|nr:hypothetical protein [Acanthamoeba polyphaga mimivirus]
MKIDDFIDFESLGKICTKSIIKCNLDKDHKVCGRNHGKNFLPDKNEILLLIAGAKKSFLFHKKIKNKYIKDIDETSLQIYSSVDKKYYSINFSHVKDGENLDFMGIFEKKSGKFFVITYLKSFKRKGYTCIENNKYKIYDYFKVNELIKKDPLDIVVNLEDKFNDMYDKIYKELNKESDSD